MEGFSGCRTMPLVGRSFIRIGKTFMSIPIRVSLWYVDVAWLREDTTVPTSFTHSLIHRLERRSMCCTWRRCKNRPKRYVRRSRISLCRRRRRFSPHALPQHGFVFLLDASVRGHST